MKIPQIYECLCLGIIGMIRTHTHRTHTHSTHAHRCTSCHIQVPHKRKEFTQNQGMHIHAKTQADLRASTHARTLADMHTHY